MLFSAELHQLPYLYAGAFLLIILIAYWLHNSRRTRNERAALKNVVRCRICAFQFRDETGVELPHCPRCQNLVERSPISRI